MNQPTSPEGRERYESIRGGATGVIDRNPNGFVTQTVISTEVWFVIDNAPQADDPRVVSVHEFSDSATDKIYALDAEYRPMGEWMVA